MPASLDALARFAQRWKSQIEPFAQCSFEYAEHGGEIAAPYVIADRAAQLFGFEPIGHNWELLDADGEPGEPRAALTNLTQALAQDMERPSVPWLGPEKAAQCARDFCEAFDPATRIIVSNRYDGLWNPISPSPVEWAFVGYDAAAIALLLIRPRT